MEDYKTFSHMSPGSAQRDSDAVSRNKSMCQQVEREREGRDREVERGLKVQLTFAFLY